jgi:hypothetical protein
MEGFRQRPRTKESRGLAVFPGGNTLLQWKPKSIVLIAVLVLAAALAGQFTWDSIDQFTWL